MNNKDYHSKLAQSSKRGLLINIDYWLNNKRFLVLIIVCLVLLCIIGTSFFPYKSEQITSGNYDLLTIVLYGTIYLIGLGGIVLALYVAFSTDIEHAIATKVFHKSDKKLDAIRSKSQSMVDLEHLRSYIPDNKNFVPSMIRLFNLVLNEAKDRRFDSSITLMIPHREDSHGEVNKIGVIQRVVLQLGILGTFIGLIGAFQELTLSQLETSLDNISNALKYSFSTSIAGLVVAILLSGILFQLRKKQEAYFQVMEQACSSLISLARNSINHDAYLSSLNTLGAAVNDNSRRSDTLNETIHVQTSAITEGMSKLEKAKKDFNDFISNLSATEDAFIQKMASIYSTLSPEKMSAQMKESLENATKEYFLETKERYKRLNNLTEQTVKNLGNMDNQLGRQVNMLSMNQKNQEEFIKKITANHIAEEVKSALVAASNETLKKINLQNNSLGNAMNRYVEAMKEANKITEKRMKIQRNLLIASTILFTIIVGLGGCLIAYKMGFFHNWYSQ